MCSHWRSSRWSSAREREERDKAKAEEREAQRKSSGKAKAPSPEPAQPTSTGTDLSDLISSGRKRQRKWPYPEETPAPAPVPEPEKPARASRRSRHRAVASTSSATATGGAGGGGGTQLPNLPDEPDGGSGSGKGTGSNRIFIFGLILFLTMGAIGIYSSGIIPGTGDNKPEPTQGPMIVPTARATSEAGVEPEPTKSSQELAEVAARDEIVCIDAGHGGWDPGRPRDANERAPKMEEADLNLGMAWMLKEDLEAEGFTVVMTRESAAPVNIFNQDVNGDGQVMQDIQEGDQAGDRDELQARINVCNEAQADILISLHINGYDDPSARGYEVWFTPPPYRPFGQQSQDLAVYVFGAMTDAFDRIGFVTNPRGAFPDTESDAQSHEGRVEEHYVILGPAINAEDFTITPSNMPGIICEAGFITNDADAAFMADPANQHVIVDAYLAGIIQYFDKYPGHFQR